MKVLLFGDASNYHNSLAKGLRYLGHQVVVASHGSTWMNTERDIDLSRHIPGRLGGIELCAHIQMLMWSGRLKGWDVVQLPTPFFTQLKPSRLRWVFDYIRANNHLVLDSAIATDPTWIDFCLDPDGMRYNEWRIGTEMGPWRLANPNLFDQWTSREMRVYTDYFLRNVDGAVSCLWEYHEQMLRVLPHTKVAYAGIPIDVDALSMRPDADIIPERVKFFIGLQRGRELAKGLDRLLSAAKRVQSDYPDRCELIVVQNLPYKEYVERMRSAHVILDQLYSYTPATNALLAMAQGVVAVSGAEPEFYEFINEHEKRPIINVVPDDEAIYDALRDIVLHPERLPELARCSRDFVVRHNHVNIVAQRFVDFWKKL